MSNATGQASTGSALWIEPAWSKEAWPANQTNVEEGVEIEIDVERWDGLS